MLYAAALLGAIQDEGLRELEGLADRLEARIEDLERALEKGGDPKLKEEISKARRELEGIRREIKGLRAEQDPRAQRERELRELIEELENAIRDEEDERKRAKLKEDLTAVRRELDDLRAKGPPKKPPKGPPEDPYLGWLRKNHPEAADNIARLRELGKLDEAERALREARDKFRTEGPPPPPPMHHPDRPAPPEARKIDEMERQGGELAERIRRAKDEKERGTLKAELKSLISKLFDLKEELRRREVEALARELEELRSQLKRRLDNRDKIIEARLRQLLGEEDGWDW